MMTECEMPAAPHVRVDPRWLGLCLLCCAFFLAVMGSTSVFTASPAIERALGLTQTGLQWSITAATLPSAALLLVGGRLADLFGRRLMLMAGLALFIASSLACGVAPGAAVLIGARFLQGVAGALFMPAALSLVIATFTEDAERNKALAAWSAIGGIGATAGLLLGGLVTAALGWRWVFLVNVPAGLLMLALCPLLLAEPGATGESGKADLRGTLTFTGGVALVTYGVTQVPSLGWFDGRTSGPGLVGCALLAAFVRIEASVAHPIVPAWLMRSRTLLSGNATLLVAGMCVDGLLFTLTLYTQQALGYSALRFGALAAVMTLSSVGASWLAQRAVTRFGAGVVSSTGLALLGATCLLFIAATAGGGLLTVLVPGMVLFGLGMGCAYVAGSVASVHGVVERDAGVAAAVQNISFGMGATLGVALFSTVSAARIAQVGGPAARLAGARAAFAAGALIALAGLCATLAIRDTLARQVSGQAYGKGRRRS
jgi:MFS family permease